jgi:hypothetical protein
LIGGKFLAFFEFAHLCRYRDKAVGVYERKLCLTAPQAQFIER